MRPNSLLIELLGGLRISSPGKPALDVAPRQAGAVLAYLALRLNRNHSREELVDVFWPEDDIEAGRAKLRKALNIIRGWIADCGVQPDSVVQAGRADIRLNPSAVATDVSELDQALAAAARARDPSEHAEFLSAAVGRYRGELLPGFYDDCFAAERNRLSIAYESALHDLIAVCEQLGELERGLEIALRAVAQNPESEDACCAAMRLFAAKGQPGAVIRQYQELERALEAEIGEKPCENTRKLMEMLAQSGCDTRTTREIHSPPALPPQVTPDSPPTIAPAHPLIEVESRPLRTSRRIRGGLVTVAAASLACAVLLWNPRPKPQPVLRTILIAELPAVAWRESYGPEEERVGREVLARWPEVEREAARLRSKPAALAAFAAPLWRIAFTLGKGSEVSDWLKEALDSNSPMKPADEATAAAAVAFQLAMDTESTESIPHFNVLPYGKRAYDAAVRSGDRWLIAHTLRALGFAETSGREPSYKVYRAHYAESYRIFRELGDERGMALVETCCASGFAVESMLVDDPQDRYRESAYWAVMAYRRWQKIGNSWGLGFTARMVQVSMSRLNRPSAEADLENYAGICSLALGVIVAERVRETAQGRLTEAGRLLASQALIKMDLDRTDEAIRELQEALEREFSRANIALLTDRLAEFTRSRGSETARRRLIATLRSIALN